MDLKILMIFIYVIYCTCRKKDNIVAKVSCWWCTNTSLHSKCFLSSLSLAHPHYFAFILNFFALFATVAQLAASSAGRSDSGAGKGRRACNYVSGIWISASKKVNAKGWLAEMTLVMTSLPLACVFNVCFIRAHFCFSLICKIWQLSRRGATGELEVEFKLQRHSCKLSFLPSLLATVTMQLKIIGMTFA